MEIKTKNRKIQQTGYSYWVTLPAVWTESVGLLKGDSVSMKILENGNLEVSKSEEAAKR